MSEQPKPVFGFLWPKPDPSAPVDAAYEQTRLVRVPRMGVVHGFLLALLTVAVAVLFGAQLLAAVGGPLWVMLATSALVAVIGLLLARAWVVGTYVNDAGFVVRRMLSATRGQWSEVRAVDDDGARVRLVLADGTWVRTHVARRGLDILGSAEAYDAARLALVHFHQAR